MTARAFPLATLAGLGGLWLAGPARAEVADGKPRSMTLAEAVQLAVRHNPALAAAGADVRAAQGAQEAAQGLDDFVVDAAALWNRSHNALVSGIPVQQPYSNAISGDLALTKPLATGGRIGLHLTGDYSLTRSILQTGPTPDMTEPSTAKDYAPSVQLRLEHPLLRGFGSEVARADRWRARGQRDVAGAQLEGAAAALVRDVASAYWELAFASQEAQIRASAAAAAREQLQRVAANISVGKLPPSASAEVEVAVALRDDGVLVAQLSVVDAALTLARLCGLPVTAGTGPLLLAADSPRPPARSFDGAELLSAALAHNPQLQALRAQRATAALEVEVTENGLLPQLDIAVSGGPTADAPTVDATYHQLSGFKNYVIQAGLIFQQALGRHAARGARTIAMEGLQKVRLGEADMATQVAIAVSHGVAAVSTARQETDVLARSTRAAALDLEAEKARFDSGRSTSFDVLRRQDALAAVQLALGRAQVDQLRAIAALQAATGEILADYGVAIP
ncbi:MAG TPA: TolC family protein [Polyangia bacterium]|nr:TolC family protein [Polyangia bacterium]